MPQLFVVFRLDTCAVHPACVPVPTIGAVNVLPVVVQNATVPGVGGFAQATCVLYLTESAKYASSAVTRFRRSDFIEAMYAFSFVFANFGIAMAAKMPMITTTISSSMSVKPFRFMLCLLGNGSAPPITQVQMTNRPALGSWAVSMDTRRDPMALRPTVTRGLPWTKRRCVGVTSRKSRACRVLLVRWLGTRKSLLQNALTSALCNGLRGRIGQLLASASPPSNASRTLRASAAGVNGFWISVVPGSSTPCFATASSAYPVMYSTRMAGRSVLTR